nr:PREDICTED: leucine-rich repeat and WD repeat-containing protein 1 [Latimeria chalumnae]|eukprot:XP_014351147.1 PREDICTED: leucine-rich repeat and WD repeat-containing protein 1 [Latimeria chalumnae]
MVRITKELLLERGLPRSSELSEIKKVNLSKLQLEIKDLDSVLFSQMEKLEELDLSHNRLTVVQKDLGLQNLRVLNLSWNQLEDVSTLKQFQQLTELNYENNLYLTVGFWNVHTMLQTGKSAQVIKDWPGSIEAVRMLNTKKKTDNRDFFGLTMRPSNKDGVVSASSVSCRSAAQSDDRSNSDTSIQAVLEKMTQLTDKLEKNMDRLEKAISTLDGNLDKIATRLVEIENRADNLEKTVEGINTKMKEYDVTTDHCLSLSKSVVRENKFLKRRLEQLDNRSRAANLRILGIPEEEGLQGLSAFLTDWIPKALHMEDSLPSPFIIKSYKIPPAKKRIGTNQPMILVKLISEDIWDLILQMARKLNTVSYQGNKILFFPDLSLSWWGQEGMFFSELLWPATTFRIMLNLAKVIHGRFEASIEQVDLGQDTDVNIDEGDGPITSTFLRVLTRFGDQSSRHTIKQCYNILISVGTSPVDGIGASVETTRVGELGHELEREAEAEVEAFWEKNYKDSFPAFPSADDIQVIKKKFVKSAMCQVKYGPNSLSDFTKWRVKNIAKELMTLMLESPKKSTSDPQEKEEQSHSEDEGGDITTGDECEDKGQSLSNPNKRRREGAEFSPSKKARPQITPVTVTLRKSHRAQVSPGKYKKLNNGQPYSTIKSGQSVKNANPACTHQGIKRNTGSPVKNDPKTCGKDIPVRGQAQRMETPMRGQAQQRETPVRGQVQQRETPVRGQVQQRETPVKDQAQHRKLKVEKEENTMMRTLTRKSKPKEPVVLEPLHFLQCHSQENNPEDWITQLWDCVFEPQLDSEHSRGSSGSVATCGGDSVCIIDCETGRVLKKYKVVGEEFFTLAWTTLTVITQEGQKKKMNVLAAAGRRGIVKLIHSKANYCYGEIKAHKKSISALCFSPKQDTFLFTGSYDKKIILWDIGVPETEYNFKVSQLLVLETDSTPLRMNLVPSCLDQYLLAACDDGCFAWDISLKKQEGRSHRPLSYAPPLVEVRAPARPKALRIGGPPSDRGTPTANQV